MGEPAIVFDGVWKKFRRGERHDSLRDLIPSIAKRFLGRRRGTELEAEEFWALKDVWFEVRTGGALGIIGPNGAGKSTVLKLLTKILKPTRGRCAVHGRVGALIEVAAGFHPDLTGRENVFLQGAIMGMKRVEIVRKFAEIVDFAGVGEFIDTPVKRYSTGMNARLGFAIAAHLDPEVLIIDEVLSVGDAGFQDRCVARMRVMRARGVPLVFVSHNLQAVQDLCNRVVVINRGETLYVGAPPEAIQAYRKFLMARANGAPRDARDTAVRIGGVQLLDENGHASEWFRTGSRMTVRILYDAPRPIERLHFAVELHRGDGVYCYGVNSHMDARDFGAVEGRGSVDLVFPRLWLNAGFYAASVGILDADFLTTHDVHHLAYPFSVASDRRDFGVVYLEHCWRHEWTTPAAKSA